MKRNVILLIVTISVLGSILSCGMVTHQEVSLRAHEKFKPQGVESSTDYLAILNRHSSFLQAGSPFPDWGYACKEHDTGEDTHWPPFSHKFIDYIKSQKEGPQKEKLISFLFGIESHQVSDIQWHWGTRIGAEEQGFLRSMSHLASYCNDKWDSGKNPSCHNIGDTGADFYLAYRKTDSWMSQFWSVPVKDLVNVYKQIGKDIKPIEISKCMVIMYVGAQMERLVTGFALFYFEQKAAFLTEDLDLFFNGGIDDMAINVLWKWQTLINILEGKADNKIRKSKFKYNNKHIISQAVRQNLDLLIEMFEIKTETDENGNINFSHNEELMKEKNEQITDILLSTIFPDKAELTRLRFIYESKINQLMVQNMIKNSNFVDSISSSKIRIKGLTSWGYFGKSLTFGDFNNDGIEELIVGEPGHGQNQTGAVYLVKDFNSELSEPLLLGLDEYSRFGFQVATVDLNHDGIDDLAVSAPTFGQNGNGVVLEEYYPKKYNGRIYIFYGSKNGLSSTPDLEILNKDQGMYLNNLGSFLSSRDCNNDGFADLLIGAPNASVTNKGNKIGFAAIYLGVKPNSKQVLLEETANFLLLGENNFSEFGKSLSCGNGNLFVGAPGSRPQKSQTENKIQSAGKVVAYKIKEDQIEKSFEVECDEAQSNFGESIDFQNDMLVVGAPSHTKKKESIEKEKMDLDFSDHNQGAVFIYDLKTLENQKENLHFINSSKASIYGRANRARFGRSVKIVGENLLIGSPMYSELLFKDEGEVSVMSEFKTLVGASINEGSKVSYLKGESENANRFGDNVVASKNGTLAVSSHLEGKKLQGEITVFLK